MCARGVLQLYMFNGALRSMPPITEVKGLHGTAMVRVLQRAAWQPWRDAFFWRQAASKVASTQPVELSGRQLAQICSAFQRIDFASHELAQYCRRYLSERQQTLNTFELAAVVMYFSAVNRDAPDLQEFVRQIADEVCIEWRQREAVPWIAWKMLVSSAAVARVGHQHLFASASPHLSRSVRFMSGRDAVDVCSAYAMFRFKHHGLLQEVHRFLPSMGLSHRDICELRAAYDRLGFDVPLLGEIHELQRAGMSLDDRLR
mmetsp:Transcript_126787/g.370623  ORF Transcript_126787/g.370623 Transcript_126787/m.370623 type:complete len:259 (+) Transcript_126787:52-828(+)